MAEPLSENLRKAILLMLVEPEFKRIARSGKAKAGASRYGIELTDDDVEQLQQLDPKELDELLEHVSSSIQHTPGGSRPRNIVRLSEETIEELRQALEDVD